MQKIRILDVIHFMQVAHKGQVRKDGITPYENHIWDVLENYKNHYGYPDELAAAVIFLHDVAEDASKDGFDLDAIELEFGKEVRDHVDFLTKPERDPSEDKLEFNNKQYKRLADNAPLLCKKIKVCDRLANLSEMTNCDKAFKYHYIQDSMNLEQALHNSGFDTQFLNLKIKEVKNEQCFKVYAQEIQ
jgi:(p)ppGpp synthase/HD superfamily hydrolase